MHCYWPQNCKIRYYLFTVTNILSTQFPIPLVLCYDCFSLRTIINCAYLVTISCSVFSCHAFASLSFPHLSLTLSLSLSSVVYITVPVGVVIILLVLVVVILLGCYIYKKKHTSGTLLVMYHMYYVISCIIVLFHTGFLFKCRWNENNQHFIRCE